MTSLVRLDGSMGEGGGQVLRTALALSLTTRRPVEVTKIRAGRTKPGLMRQHLTAVQAAAAVGSARVAGAEIGSRELRFEPGAIRSRNRADVLARVGGSGGSRVAPPGKPRSGRPAPRRSFSRRSSRRSSRRGARARSASGAGRTTRWRPRSTSW